MQRHNIIKICWRTGLFLPDLLEEPESVPADDLCNFMVKIPVFDHPPGDILQVFMVSNESKALKSELKKKMLLRMS